MMRFNNKKMRNLFMFMGFAMVFLVAVVFLFNPNKTFSQFAPVVSEERQSIKLSANSNGIPSHILSDASYSYTDRYANIYANYFNALGDSFDSSVGIMEYSCGNGDTCEFVASSSEIDERFGMPVMQFYIDFSTTDVAELPAWFEYNGVKYYLGYYFVSYLNYVEDLFCKPRIEVNGKSHSFMTYDVYGETEYFSSAITPSSDMSDEVHFNWDYFASTVKINNKVIGEGADLNKEFKFEVLTRHNLPDGMYGDVEFSNDMGRFTLKANESVNLDVPGNMWFKITPVQSGYVSSNNYNSLIGLYNSAFVANDLVGGEITYTHEFTAAKPLTIRHNVSGGGNLDKEFGYTVRLVDNTINDVYSDVVFTNGIGRFYLKSGESKTFLFPYSGVSYYIYATDYSDYSYNSPSNNYGKISSTDEILVDYTYVYNSNGNADSDGVYSATVVSAEEMIPGRSYVAFRATGGVGYLLTGKGNAKQLTSYCDGRGCKVTWPDSGDAYANVLWTYTGTLDKALFESFGAVNTYMTVGKNTSGKNPVGNEISYVKLETSSSPAMKVSNDGYYLALTSDKKKFTSSTSGSSLYFAEIDEDIYTVEFNGSNDGLHIYDGAVDKDYKVIEGDTIIAPTIDNVKNPLKYDYKLESWIELTTGIKVIPGEELTVNGDYKFYANWVPKSYDIGVNKDVISNLDTSNFIKTEMFDYNELYNLYSANYVNNRWSLLEKGNQVYFNSSVSPITSRGVVFFDNAKNSKNGLLNSIDDRDSNNASKQVNNGKDFYDGTITKGISSYVINDLFNKDSSLYGVNYIGSDKYLYQYDEKSGYYYYDSTKNAASYNKNDGRFYVYDYTYGTSKSYKDGENKSDFLPFNYMTKKDAESGKSISASNGATNYWFGLKSEISFDLVDDVGTIVGNGEYGNKDINGNDMILKFSGDDDVWVFVDDRLVLDLGGAHDIVYGEINFSTGVVTTAHNGASINYDAIGGFGINENEILDSTKIQQSSLTGISAGAHKVTFYYVERGASQSNVSLYFNISKGYRDPGAIIISRDKKSYASLEKHDFTITLSDNSINGYYGEADFAAGVAMFRLAGGESLTISGLPAGLNYVVSVKAPVEHTTQFTSNGKVYATRTLSGRVVGGNISEVEYINNYSEYSSDSNDEVIPDTFDSTIIYIILLGISLFIIGVVFVIKKNNKNKTNNDIEVL